MTTSFWTVPIAWEGSPIDHLGLGALGQSLADITVPGLTNGTDRARVYTVAAWITRIAKSRDDARRLESAWIAAVSNHAEHDGGLSDSGVVGIRSAPESTSDGVSLDFKRNVSLFDAQSYGPSAVRLGAVGRRDRSSLRHTPSGDPVAEQLAASVSIDTPVLLSILKGHLDPDQLRALDPLCVCQRPKGDELPALIDLFLRLEHRRPADIEKKVDAPRRAAFLLLLDGLDSSPRSTDEVLDRFAGWASGTSRDWQPSQALERCAYEYSALALRSLFKGTLEALLCLVLRDAQLRDGRLIDPVGVTDRILEEVSSSEALRVTDGHRPMDVARELADQGPMLASSFTIIEDAIPARGVSSMAGLMIVATLLRIAGSVERLASRDAGCAKFMSVGAAERLPLSTFMQFVESSLDMERLVRDLINVLCVHQHLGTAARKFGHGAADGFLLSVEHGGIRALEGSEGIRPVFTGIKIRTLFGLSRDVGLCEGTPTAASRTDEGEAALARGLEVLRF